jgi:hypothetical protein
LAGSNTSLSLETAIVSPISEIAEQKESTRLEIVKKKSSFFNRKGQYDKYIAEFNQAMKKGVDGLKEYFKGLAEKPEFRSSYSKGAPDLPAEVKADYGKNVKELGLKLTPDEDKKLQREVLKYFNDKGELHPAVKAGRTGGYAEKLESIRKAAERQKELMDGVYNELYSRMKDTVADTITPDQAADIAKQFIG